jgi:hypothetical protein
MCDWVDEQINQTKKTIIENVSVQYHCESSSYFYLNFIYFLTFPKHLLHPHKMHNSDETQSSCSHFSQSNTLLWAMLQYSFMGLKMSTQRLGNISYCEDVKKKARCHCFWKILASEIRCNEMLVHLISIVYCLTFSINSVLAVQLSISVNPFEMIIYQL